MISVVDYLNRPKLFITESFSFSPFTTKNCGGNKWICDTKPLRNNVYYSVNIKDTLNINWIEKILSLTNDGGIYSLYVSTCCETLPDNLYSLKWLLSMVFSVLLFTEMGGGLLCEFWSILSLMIGNIPVINKL